MLQVAHIGVRERPEAPCCRVQRIKDNVNYGYPDPATVDSHGVPRGQTAPCVPAGRGYQRGPTVGPYANLMAHRADPLVVNVWGSLGLPNFPTF